MNPQISEITEIPIVSNLEQAIGEVANIYKFRLSGLNVSIANAIRRIILTYIPTYVIRTEKYEDNQCDIAVNTTRMHNEIIKQRLSCIPIHLKVGKENWLLDYQLEVDLRNDTDNVIYVTTEAFKLKNKKTNQYLSREDTKKIFPPNLVTNSYIDFVRLRPKISDSIPGEHIKLTANFGIGNAKENSMFNVVSKCTFMNTIDLNRVQEVWDEKERTIRQYYSTLKDVEENAMNKEIEFEKKNFYLLDAQRYYVEDSFDFSIQSIGVYDNDEIMKLACMQLIEKIQRFIDSLDQNIVPILNSETTIENSYDVILEDEDYTLGKILEFMLYENYYEKEDVLSFCAFKKMHPHNDNGVLRIAFTENIDRNYIQQILRGVSVDAQEIYKKIYKMF